MGRGCGRRRENAHYLLQTTSPALHMNSTGLSQTYVWGEYPPISRLLAIGSRYREAVRYAVDQGVVWHVSLIADKYKDRDVGR